MEQNTKNASVGSMLDSCVVVEENLYLLTGTTGYEVFEKCRATDYAALVESCYKEFDVTVISLVLPLEGFASSILHRSDFCLLPNCRNTVGAKEAKELLEHIERKYNIRSDKFSYLAYEYKKGIHLSLAILNRLYGKNFMGCVRYDLVRGASCNS